MKLFHKSSSTRRLIVITLFLLSCNMLQLVAQAKPNILFIFADDQTYTTLGMLDDCPVKTPNLDRLAEQGVRFSHSFNMGSFAPAVCIASRTMLNTGYFIWTAADYAKKSKTNTALKEPEAYWSEYMKQAGYDTYLAGKWHVKKDATAIFDHTVNIRAGMPKQTQKRYERSFKEETPDTWSPYDESLGGYWQGGKHWSEVLADDGIAFLEQAKDNDQPFFMYLGFNAPHDPRQSPKRFVDMYPVEEINVPENFLPEYPYNKHAGAGRGLRDEKLAPFPRTEYSIKQNRQEYYAIITHMDEQIGRILHALEASGKADNTYIFFTADHGLAVGEHGFLGKQNMYDCSMRVPLIIKGKGIEPGKVVDAPVYLQDIMATTIELAGMEKPKTVDFHSLLPLAKGERKESDYGAIYGAYFNYQRMIRTDRYKMIIYPTANMVRLYDIVNDPMEMHDLAETKSKKNVRLMKQLFTQFQELQKEMDDPMDASEAFDNFLAGVEAPAQKK